MDENYLDNLLNEFSLDKEIDHNIEEELDSQMQEEKKQKQEEHTVSQEEQFDQDLLQDSRSMAEEEEPRFSEEQMDELDELDHLADLEMKDMDFSDIDFDDLDMTNLQDVNTEDLDDLLKEFEGDLDIGKLDDTETEKAEPVNPETVEQAEAVLEEPVPVAAPKEEEPFDTDRFLNDMLQEDANPADIPDLEEPDDMPAEKADRSVPDHENGEALEDTGDLTATEHKEEAEEPVETETLEETEGPVDLEALTQFMDPEEGVAKQDEEPGSSQGADTLDDLNDLFSMLDLDEAPENADSTDIPAQEQQTETNQPELTDEGMQETPKKFSLMRLLFGDPDEDDELTEEELAAEAAKAEKKKAAKAAKKEKAEAAKKEKEEANARKKQEASEKKKVVAQKKARMREEANANREPDVKLNKPAVVFIFTFFLGGALLLFAGMNQFNYSQAIEKATNYFANQKYRKAYDEIVGVRVKEKDQELKDRIYTVMYVERLYESYENNTKLNRPEKALDALLRGVDKYYEHYEEAKELDIVDDIDYSYAKITKALQEQYGITIDQAQQINAMEANDYVKVIREYTTPKETESSEDSTAKQEEEEVTQ